jgi:cytochrome P450
VQVQESPPVYVVNSPDGVNHILRNRGNYSKDKVPQFQIIKGIVDNVLLFLEGDAWRRLRRLMQPAFHRQYLAGFGAIMTGRTLRLLGEWAPGQQVDLNEVMRRLTLQILAETPFSEDVTEEVTASLLEWIEASQHYFQIAFLPTASSIQREEAKHRVDLATLAIDALVADLITKRRRAPDEGLRDLLFLLLQAQDEEGGHMSERMLRDQVIGFLAAGFESSANTLAWAWYLLAHHLEVEQRLHTELARVLRGHVPTTDDLPQLPFCRWWSKKPYGSIPRSG